MDNQGLDEAEVDMLLDGGLSRVSEDGGLGINHKVDSLIEVDPAHIASSHLDKSSVSVVEFSFNFALHEGLPVLGLVDPLSVVVADSEANIDDISVI